MTVYDSILLRSSECLFHVKHRIERMDFSSIIRYRTSSIYHLLGPNYIVHGFRQALYVCIVTCTVQIPNTGIIQKLPK